MQASLPPDELAYWGLVISRTYTLICPSAPRRTSVIWNGRDSSRAKVDPSLGGVLPEGYSTMIRGELLPE
jgi:hypothetical protein